MLKYKTISSWDEQLWEQASIIYEEAFRDHSPKSDAIIRNMFVHNLCYLHVVINEREHTAPVIGMAISGKLPLLHSCLIDYIAISKKHRNNGYGSMLVNYIKNWAITTIKYDGMIVEVEADNTEINKKRINFWEKCGFQQTNYIHKYIWVPEPYMAMYQRLSHYSTIPANGVELFKHIGTYHKKCFQGQKVDK